MSLQEIVNSRHLVLPDRKVDAAKRFILKNVQGSHGKG